MPKVHQLIFLTLIIAITWTLIACDDSNAPRLVDDTAKPRANRAATPRSHAASARPKQPPTDAEQRQLVLAAREQKDQDLREVAESPLPEAERPNFRGLKYFDFDPAYRVEAELVPYSKPETIKMVTTKGDMDQYTQYGQFKFTLAGKDCTLDVFKSSRTEQTRLFLPFRDTTNGKETYGAGRYIDLEETTNNRYLLDFNLAYNPYCAYNERYSCPLPPPQNTLKVAIRAGEKTYH
jgi:uncharacterized protein (DUF1684 family)